MFLYDGNERQRMLPLQRQTYASILCILSLLSSLQILPCNRQQTAFIYCNFSLFKILQLIKHQRS